MVKKKVNSVEKIPEDIDNPIQLGDEYTPVGLINAAIDFESFERIHDLVTSVFDKRSATYVSGLNHHLLEEYNLKETATREEVMTKLSGIFSGYNDISWVKRVWIYFWMLTIGHKRLVWILKDFWKVETHTQLLEKLREEITPQTDRWMAIWVFYIFMLDPPRNDKIMVGSYMMSLYYKTMFILADGNPKTELAALLDMYNNPEYTQFSAEERNRIKQRIDLLQQKKTDDCRDC